MEYTPKKTVPVTKYVVQCLNPGGGWFPYEKSLEVIAEEDKGRTLICENRD